MKHELEKLYAQIDETEIAMMTTRRPDGHLQSRAMATQKRAEGADLWFVTAEGAQKLTDLATDPHVNLSYYKDRTREWFPSPDSRRSRAIVTRSMNCTRPTGRHGSRTKAIPATARRTTLDWY